MKAPKFGGYAILVLILLGGAGFFVLGLMSQDGKAPGLVKARLAPCPDSPNCVSSEAGTAAHAVTEPLPLDAWDRLPAIIAAQGGTVTNESEDYIATEFKSAVFGFVDDVEFRRGEDTVHLRSASRVGYSDAGANAARVTALRDALEPD